MATTNFIDHLLEGNHASRPAFGDVPEGTLYACSDHGLIYQSDGSSAWSTWATLGATIADILDLDTAETDDTLVLAPDGAGGVEFRAEAGGTSGLIDSARHKRTAGSYTLNSTTWADVDSGTDLVVDAEAGDIITATASWLWGGENVDGYIDVATIVAAAVVNVIGGNGATADGLSGWAKRNGAAFLPMSGSVDYVVQAGDISTGTVTLRLRYRTSTATNLTLWAVATTPLMWSVKVFRA